MGIHEVSGDMDNEQFLTAASALDCTAGVYSVSGFTVLVHKRQCWLKDSLQLLPRLTQRLEHEKSIMGITTAAQNGLKSTLFEWRQVQV